MKNLTIELSYADGAWRADCPQLELFVFDGSLRATVERLLDATLETLVLEHPPVQLVEMHFDELDGQPLSTGAVDKLNETMRRPPADEPRWTTNERLLGEDLREECGNIGPMGVGGFSPLCTQKAGHAGDHVSWGIGRTWPQEAPGAPVGSAAAQHEAEGFPAVVGRYEGSEGHSAVIEGPSGDTIDVMSSPEWGIADPPPADLAAELAALRRAELATELAALRRAEREGQLRAQGVVLEDQFHAPEKITDVRLSPPRAQVVDPRTDEPRWASTSYDSSEWGSGACSNCGRHIQEHSPGRQLCPVPG